jgi:L,D-transpeptidase catalytic domain
LLVSRRIFLSVSLAHLSSATLARAALEHAPAPGSVPAAGDVPDAGSEESVGVAPILLERALLALERHSDGILHRDVIGVTDFSLHSGTPRFHLVNLTNGSVRSHLVAHGRGSDPAHTGWLERFSNEPGSNATSAGAYRTGAAYLGAHGHSMHLDGLDPTNSNAAARAIVVHGAWYVNEAMGHSGGLGRSEGCFAVANSSVDEIMAALGPGRLIYADRQVHG